MADLAPRRPTLRPERIRRIAGSSPDPLVLILTNEHDVSADWVVRELRRRGVPYLRLNTERLPQYALVGKPAEGKWRVSRDGITSVLDSIRGVWFRRPEVPGDEYFAGLSRDEIAVASDQWRGVVSGLRSLPGAKWINPPERNALGETKTVQLQLASSLGFRVPDTLITNSGAEAFDFMERHPSAVVKAIRTPLIHSCGETRFVYTERLTQRLLEGLRELEPVPFILQEEIGPKLDVRVTVVGDEAMAACLTEPATEVDWRAQKPPGRFRKLDLPDDVKALCIRLVCAMGLSFGAIDLLEDEHGDWFFLEINPNGEWGWLQKTTGLPIARSDHERPPRMRIRSAVRFVMDWTFPPIALPPRHRSIAAQHHDPKRERLARPPQVSGQPICVCLEYLFKRGRPTVRRRPG